MLRSAVMRLPPFIEALIGVGLLLTVAVLIALVKQ